MKKMTQAPTRTQKRSIETRKRIFAKAMALFLEKGFEEVTVAKITEAADVGKGTFFTHFPTKEAVLAEIGGLIVSTMEAAAATPAARRMSARARILHILTSTVRWHQKNTAMSRLMVEKIMANPGVLQADLPHQMRFGALLTGIVDEGQRNGEFKERPDAVVVAQGLMGIYFFTVLCWHRFRVEENLGKQLGDTADLLLGGLSK